MEDPRLRRRRGLAAARGGRVVRRDRAVHPGRIPPLTGDGGIRYTAFWDWLDTHLPGGPCCFLDLVGVALAAQGRELAGPW